MRSAGRNVSRSAPAAVLVAVIALAGCGSSSSSTHSPAGTSTGGTGSTAAPPPTPLALTITEAGKSAKYSGPSSVKGGLVTVALTNSGKAPHGAQLVRILGKHTIVQALMTLGGMNPKKPSWVRAEGGVGVADPGSTGSATVDLPPGNYAIVDLAGAQSGSGGPPAFSALSVMPGPSAKVPVIGTTVTAAAPSKDHYKWELSGAFKTGANSLTFVSKGTATLHVLTAVRITGSPSKAQIIKDLASNGNPPSYVDQASQVQTAVLDGGKSLSTQLTFPKPGKYILFCPLRDRDGGKFHFAEGLLTTITVQ